MYEYRCECVCVCVCVCVSYLYKEGEGTLRSATIWHVEVCQCPVSRNRLLLWQVRSMRGYHYGVTDSLLIFVLLLSLLYLPSINICKILYFICWVKVQLHKNGFQVVKLATSQNMINYFVSFRLTPFTTVCFLPLLSFSNCRTNTLAFSLFNFYFLHPGLPQQLLA
jgi:hypothetical protein